MTIPKADQITNILDTAKIAVDQSAFGPMFQYPDERNVTEKQVNQLAWNVYLHVITAMLKDLNQEKKEND